MAELTDKMQKDLIEAMKKSDDIGADALRMVVSRLKNEKISKGEDLTDEEEIKIVFSEAKKIKDSIQQFKDASREDLVAREEQQLVVVEKYLPEQAGDDEINSAVENVISEMGANGMGDFGRVMGAVMAKLQGVADGSEVSRIVKEQLSK